MPMSRALPWAARRACTALLLGTAFAAMAGSALAGTTESRVQVRDAWIRWLPAGLPAGGYMRLHNDGAHAVALIGASSADYGEVMLHRSSMQGGSMQMLPVQRAEIPAHGDLVFQPGGYHLMLMKPRKGVQPGQQVPVTLSFSDGSRLDVPFTVRKPDTGGAPAQDMHGMSMR